MHRIVLAIGCAFALALSAAGFVALARHRLGRLSPRQAGASAAGMTLLVLAGALCFVAVFVLGGGPDGRFMSGSALLNGALGLAATLLVAVFSLRCLAMAPTTAALFVAPAALVLAGQAAGLWPLSVAAFASPLICVLLIVALWMRRELHALDRPPSNNP